MALLTTLAIAGVCYCTVLLPDFPQTVGQFLMEFAVKGCCALGIASLMCLLAFLGLEFLYHRELEQHREARRQHLIGAPSLPPVPAVGSVPVK
jgi:hypothetical protein